MYAPAWVPVTHELMCRAAALLMPDEAAGTGRSGLAGLGADLTRPTDPVEVVVPEWARFGPVRGLSVRLSTYPVAGGCQREVRLPTPNRLAFDVAARRPLGDAVAGLDAGLRLGYFDKDQAEAWLKSSVDHDVVAVRKALALSDPRAESPPESIVRVVLSEAGIAVEPQHVVQDGSRFVARVDLAVPSRRLAIEYDGRWHRLGTQPAKDRQRSAELRRCGWSVVVINADLLGDPAAMVAVVRAALAERPHFPQ